MAADPWVWGWEAVAAIATVAATFVALGIAVAGSVGGMRARRTQARATTIAMWPYLHSARGALFRIEMRMRDNVSVEMKRALGEDCAALELATERIELLCSRLDRAASTRMTSFTALSRFVAMQAQRIADQPGFGVTTMLVAGLGDQLIRDARVATAMADAAVEESEKAAGQESGRPLPRYDSELTADLDEQ